MGKCLTYEPERGKGYGKTAVTAAHIEKTRNHGLADRDKLSERL